MRTQCPVCGETLSEGVLSRGNSLPDWWLRQPSSSSAQRRDLYGEREGSAARNSSTIEVARQPASRELAPARCARNRAAASAAAAQGAMGRADLEIRIALDNGRQRRLSKAQLRRCLDAIDDGLERLEKLHLADLPISHLGGCRKVLEGLIVRAGEEPPEAVRTARTSYALHSALLNWESAVLDALVPHRRELFPDLNQDCDDRPGPRRRRPQSQLSRQLVAG